MTTLQPATPRPDPAGDQRRLRTALVCDFLEEGWPSMDLFGDMLASYFQKDYALQIEVEQLRPALRARFSALPFPVGSRLLWNADRLINRFQDYPRWLKNQASRFDLFHIIDHSYSQLVLSLPSERTIVTCHDLDAFRCLLEPDSERRPRWFRAMARRTLAGFLRASHVICVSAFTKSQLLRHGMCSEDRLSIISPGVNPVFFSTVDPQLAVQAVGASEGPYLLHVGSTIPRKRIDTLLLVFSRVLKEFPQLRLVRVGGKLTREQSELEASLKLDGKIVHAPRLSEAQLAAVYGGAALLLQTSEAEGFGLPVIEAMACGCPVVSSDIAPLREAGGPAADYCPVAQVDSWAETVIRLLDERATDPKRWENRQQEARRWASAFTWSQNAKQTMDVYRRVLTGEK